MRNYNDDYAKLVLYRAFDQIKKIGFVAFTLTATH